jgi:transposase-like protein
MSEFKWTPKASAAATALAEGKTREEVAKEIGISERTLYRWLTDDAFKAEVDNLSLMIGISSRAERLRLAKRFVRQKTGAKGELISDKDLLDWLKFAQSETDGVKLDLAKIAEALGKDSE